MPGRRRNFAKAFTKSTDDGLKLRRRRRRLGQICAPQVTNGYSYSHSLQSGDEQRSGPNILALLYRREIGTLWDQFDLCRKQLGSDDDDVDCESKAISWHHFSRRLIPFSKLETPLSDAVLAMDRTGSYLISLGDGRGRVYESLPESGMYPSLAIRFYAMPSPSSLAKRRNIFSPCHRIVSSHISTIPLIFRTDDDDDYGSGVNNAATTPVQILVSSDGVLGAAFLHHVKQDEDESSTVTIFPLPNNDCDRFEKIYTIANVPIGGLRTHSMRNLLWKTKLIPMMISPIISGPGESAMNNNRTCFNPVCQHGYVLFNDEEDGFRIFWISTNVPVDSTHVVRTHFPGQNIMPKMNDIVSPCSENERVTDSTWIDLISGSKVGQPPLSDRGCSKITIAFEAYLNIEALLTDILLRRKKLVTTNESPHLRRVPEYFYNLVSFGDNNDRSVCLVIVFANPIFSKSSKQGANPRMRKLPAAYGLYITLDLFDQSYSEGDWVSHPCNHDSSFLRQWANKLALSKRIADMRVGPYCTHVEKGKQTHFGNIKYHERNVDDTLLDKCSSFWSSFVENAAWGKGKMKKSSPPPKTVAMSSLYPFCDVITNRAVTSATPVTRIECRDFPLTLTYTN